MPNWVNNELTLYAKGEEGRRQLSEFRLTLEPKKTKLAEYETPPEERKDEDDENGFGLDFNIFIPYPVLITERLRVPQISWRCSKWNTKWNACETRILKENEDYMKIGFDTAWSPPIPVIAKIAERFPDLEVKLKYWEGGNAFRGRHVWKNGNLTETWEGEYRGNRGG